MPNIKSSKKAVKVIAKKTDANHELKARVKNLIKACEKRPVTMSQIDALVADIEKKVYNRLEEEISSKEIGEYVMAGLKELDEVSYVRFASVYKQFKDISTFFDFINDFEKMLKTPEKNKKNKE